MLTLPSIIEPLPGEQWLPVNMEHYRERYMVSDQGRVCRVAGGQGAKIGLVKPQNLGNGYHVVSMSANGDKQQFLVHRLVALTFIENLEPERRTKVNHRDGIKTSNAASNLEWVTPSENSNHAIYNLNAVGRKLNAALADDIREAYNRGEKQTDLAKRYGVSQNQISLVVQNKVWVRADVAVKMEPISAYEVPSPGPEEWRLIVGSDGFMISNYGRARSAHGKILAEHYHNDYARVNIKIGPKHEDRRTCYVHQLVARAFLGPSDGREVNHRSMNRRDNRSTNLEYVSRLDNIRLREGYARSG